MAHRRLTWTVALALSFAAPSALFPPTALAQSQIQATQVSGAITGTVSDPSGARIPNAAVHVENDRLKRDTVTDAAGRFSLDLPTGTYKMDILSDGFEPFVREGIAIAGKALKPLVLTLPIATSNEIVTVDASKLAGTGADENASSLVFDSKNLDTLSNDDATLQQQVLAIAGGDGQHPPQIFVDGFSGGRFPPKSSIREIRINQNPYSAAYDGLGFGRVEILTKPGSDKLHGFFQTQGNDRAFNSNNPFTGAQPPYHTLNLDGNVSGPIGKKTSFFLAGTYNDQQNNTVVNAQTLDANNNPFTFSQAIPDPQVFHTYSARLDRQLTKNNTLTSRYEYNQINMTNGGIGLLVLPTEGYNNSTTTQTLQIGNSEIIGPHLINDTRFQYIRTRLAQTPVSSAPTVIVQGVFSGGGSALGLFHDNQDRYEFQDYLSIDHGKHFLRLGIRYRLLRDSNLSNANYNGQYIYPDLNTYQITQQGLANHLTAAQILANGGGATQFSLTAGQSSAAITTADVGIYADDEWKLNKNVTLNFGVRFESQTAIPDRSDPAPRMGFAWAVHQADKHPAWFVLRGGFGLFYSRFDAPAILSAKRQNGVTQQSYFVQNPDPTVTYTPANLTGTAPTIYQIDPHLRSNYDIISGLSVERSLGKIGSITVNYLNIRSVHQFVSLNVNAPLPGTYDPSVPNSGTRPLGGTQNLYQYSSAGEGVGNILFTNYNLHPVKWFTAWGFYVNQHAKSDAAEPGGYANFVSNSYNPHADYGASSYDVTNRLFTGGSFNLPKGITLEPFFIARGGRAFNITTGADNNGDSIYNDRPAFATDLTRASVVKTSFGNFDTSPIAGQKIIPSNYGRGPTYLSLQLSLNKSFKFGPRRVEAPDPSAPPPPPPAKGAPTPKPDPAYELGFSAEGQNVLNHVNGAIPIGVLTSPFFGKSLSLESGFFNNSAANRTINLRAFFRF
ncbi:TonB-dependent receptor [Granulicella tundricola]|nr:carboxypeptidase regulatory-like domain-containing protein [Granulicella tundricola]